MEDTTNKTVLIWVCPTPSCNSYYATNSRSGKQLDKNFTGPAIEEAENLKKQSGSPYRHSRAACPLCREQGHAVERVPVKTVISVPTAGPKTPELPKNYRG